MSSTLWFSIKKLFLLSTFDSINPSVIKDREICQSQVIMGYWCHSPEVEYPVEPYKWGLLVVQIRNLMLDLSFLLTLSKSEKTLLVSFYCFGQVTVILLSLDKTLVIFKVIFNDSIRFSQQELINRLWRFNLLFLSVAGFPDLHYKNMHDMNEDTTSFT